MSGYEAEVLAQQLAQLGRDLSAEVVILGELEEAAVDAEGEFRRLEAEHDDNLDRAFLASEGNVEVRKASARLKCVPSRLFKQDANLDWNHARARVRTQNANLSALHRRVEIGRSLLSREKSLLSLAGIGET